MRQLRQVLHGFDLCCTAEKDTYWHVRPKVVLGSLLNRTDFDSQVILYRAASLWLQKNVCHSPRLGLGRIFGHFAQDDEFSNFQVDR